MTKLLAFINPAIGALAGLCNLLPGWLWAMALAAAVKAAAVLATNPQAQALPIVAVAAAVEVMAGKPLQMVEAGLSSCGGSLDRSWLEFLVKHRRVLDQVALQASLKTAPTCANLAYF